MGLVRTIAEVIPLAVTVAFTMLPIIATLAVLVSSEHATRGFLLSAGYAAGLALVLGAATFGLLRSGTPRLGISPIVFVVAGILLLVLAAWRYVRRRHASTHPTKSPALLGRLENLSGPGAFAIGFQFAFHPENLLLTGAASTKIVTATLPAAGLVIVVAVFCLIGVSTVVVPSVVYALAGAGMKSALTRLRDWLLGHANAITCALLAVAGIALVAYGGWKFLS